MQVTIEDTSLEAAAGETCGQVLSRAISGKRMKNAVACLVDGQARDLTTPLSDGTHDLAPIAVDSPQGLAIIRHSAAHIMAEAVKKLFPSVQVTIGPSIENGFYYDFAFERPFTPEDLEAIEAEMRACIAANLPFSCTHVSKTEAKELFSSLGEVYKLEIMDENIVGDTVSLYRQGSFTDLCRGPHVPATGMVRAIKLLSVAGAYWRGDEKRPMLQRIYGTAFASEADLKTYLHHLEEAKKRDHRKLGTQLDLFSFSEEVGAGMAIWHPKGELIRTILEDFERREHLRRGYQLVRGPMILRSERWERSGHYDNYRENMKEHDAVVFNGDGYSEAWHIEAERRGLPNLKTTPDALPVLGSPEVVKLFTTYGVFSEAEVKSREEIYLEQYCKTIQTEANLVVRMAKTIIFPAAMRYQGELATTCVSLKAIGHDFKMDTLEDVTAKLRDLQGKIADLEKLMEHSDDNTLAEAKYLCCTILPAMNEVRAIADALEAVVADDLWSLPSYQEMLFIR